MLIVGSANITQQFSNLGLIDEYHFLVHPVVLGIGKPLFKINSLEKSLQLNLYEVKKFSNGVVGLFYNKG